MDTSRDRGRHSVLPAPLETFFETNKISDSKKTNQIGFGFRKKFKRRGVFLELGHSPVKPPLPSCRTTATTGHRQPCPRAAQNRPNWQLRSRRSAVTNTRPWKWCIASYGNTIYRSCEPEIEGSGARWQLSGNLRARCSCMSLYNIHSLIKSSSTIYRSPSSGRTAT